ncbi:MAG: MFS transporter [Candidatus Saccharimonadales bacterium]
MKLIPKNFLPIATVYTLAASMGYVLAPIESLYIKHLDSNGFVIGSVFALGSILMTVLSLWFGHLADKGKRHRLIFLGLLAATVYPFLYANVINAFQYAGVKAVWAVTGVATGPLLAAYIQESLSGENSKGKWFGYLYAAGSLVGALAHYIGGYVGQHFGLKEVYVVVGFIGIVNFIFAAFFLRPIKFKKQEKAPARMILSGFKYFFEHKPLTFYLVMNMAVDLNFTVKYFLWPLAIFQVSHKVIDSGSIFATMGVVAFIVLATSHKWADRVSPYKNLFSPA